MLFGVLIFPEAEELDFVGPWEMLGMWAREPEGPRDRLIVAETQEPVRCAKGLSVNPHTTFERCPDLDCLLVPGGQGTRTQVDNPALVAFIQRQASRCRALLSVCTGSFLLHRAGLLKGARATTHWASLDRMRALGGVEVVEERFVQDGRIWTSAGVSAGMDMILAFIASVSGEAVAGKVQRAAEYYPSRRIYGRSDQLPQAPRYLLRE
jgi:transcriptional regulator GlxA family with amidase domain